MIASKNNNKSQSPPKSNNKTRIKAAKAKSLAKPTNRDQGLTIVGIGASAGGLMRLRHRLNLMGCNLQVRSQPGKGTQVEIDVQPNQGNI